MGFAKLNPAVHSAAIITKLGNSAECRAYDSRIIYIYSGDISATVNGKKYSHLGAGEILYIPAGMPYSLKGKYLEAAVITFDTDSEGGELCEKIAPSASCDFDGGKCRYSRLCPFDKEIRLADMESEANAIEKICNLFISKEGLYLPRASAMLKSILLKLAESVDENALPARMVESLDNYIRENFTEDISNTELGAIFGYHPFYISKVLKDKKGITLKQYIIKYKLAAARAMLENSSKSINEIAEETGFTDASYFTKTFKNAFGETPKKYRDRFKDGFV